MVTLPPFVAAYALHSWQFSSPRKPSSNVFPCPLSAIEPASVYWASLVAQLVKNLPAMWET